MLILVGYVIVIGSVLGGYAMVGGHMGALYQPAELVIIFGAGIGAFVAANNGKGISATMRTLPRLMRGSQYSKEICVDLMTLLYLLLAKARQRVTGHQNPQRRHRESRVAVHQINRRSI